MQMQYLTVYSTKKMTVLLHHLVYVDRYWITEPESYRTVLGPTKGVAIISISK